MMKKFNMLYNEYIYINVLLLNGRILVMYKNSMNLLDCNVWFYLKVDFLLIICSVWIFVVYR